MLCHKCVRGRYKKWPLLACSSHRCHDEARKLGMGTIDLPEYVIDEKNDAYKRWTHNSFLKKCLRFEARPDEIDDYVDKWHDGNTGVEIYAFLGLTIYEYAEWVEQKVSIDEIVERHKKAQEAHDKISLKK
jgi:hypothetical protein